MGGDQRFPWLILLRRQFLIKLITPLKGGVLGGEGVGQGARRVSSREGRRPRFQGRRRVKEGDLCPGDPALLERGSAVRALPGPCQAAGNPLPAQPAVNPQGAPLLSLTRLHLVPSTMEEERLQSAETLRELAILRVCERCRVRLSPPFRGDGQGGAGTAQGRRGPSGH